jgi:hypothetical protein
MILDLRNETTWTRFLWYLAVPSGNDFLHLYCMADQPKFGPTSPTLQNLFLKKARLKYGPVLVISLPQGLGDCKPFDWDSVDAIYLSDLGAGRAVPRPVKLRAPQEVSSGYLKDSAPPKT